MTPSPPVSMAAVRRHKCLCCRSCNEYESTLNEYEEDRNSVQHAPDKPSSSRSTMAGSRKGSPQMGLDGDLSLVEHALHGSSVMGMLLATRVLSSIPKLGQFFHRKIVRLQEVIAIGCEEFEHLSSLAIMSILVDVRRKWVCTPVFRAWSQVILPSKDKVIRGREMAEPARRGIEALDPLEQSYNLFYQSELKQHMLDEVRKAASRLIKFQGDKSRLNTANFDAEGAANVRTGDAANSLNDNALQVSLHDWIRAATPPVMSSSQNKIFRDCTSGDLAGNWEELASESEGLELDAEVAGLTTRFEEEKRRKEAQRNADIADKNAERKRMDEMIVLLRQLGAEHSIPRSLIVKVLAEGDPGGFQHWRLAQALLTHLKYNQCDIAKLIEVDPLAALWLLGLLLIRKMHCLRVTMLCSLGASRIAGRLEEHDSVSFRAASD
jgi:hypothetical protein